MRRFNAAQAFWAKTLAAANTVWPQTVRLPESTEGTLGDVARVVEGLAPARGPTRPVFTSRTNMPPHSTHC